MSPGSTLISISGNAKKIDSYVRSYNENKAIKFIEESILKNTKYQILLVNTSENLEDITQKIIDSYSRCRENNSKIVVLLIFNSEINRDKVIQFQKLLSDIGRTNPIHRLVITKDLYQTEKKSITELDDQLRNLLNSNEINISEKGNNVINPLHLNDLINGVVKILFLNSTAGKTYYLLGESIKDLDLAYYVKKILEDSVSNFQINSVKENIPINSEILGSSNSTAIEINWFPEKDFNSELKKIYENKNENYELIEESTEKRSQISSNIVLDKIINLKRIITQATGYLNIFKKSKEKKSRNNILKRLVAVVIIIYFSIVTLFIGSMYCGYKSMTSSLISIKEGDLHQSVVEINKNGMYNEIAMNIYWSVRPIVKIISKKSDEEIHSLFSLNEYLKNSITNLQQAYVLAEKIYLSFIDKNTTINIQDQTLGLKTSLSQVFDNIAQIQIMVKSNSLPKSIQEIIINDQNYKDIDTIENQLSQAIKLLNVLPSLSKENADKTTLVLVQDQDELRSLGGVIKYLITIKITNNKLAEVKILEQKDIDSLIDGSTMAPEMIAKITGDKNWKIKDMSYFGDFSQTAQYISWYLSKISDIKPDAIVSINKSFFEKLLEQDGKISYLNREITKDNLIPKINEIDDGLLKNIIEYYLAQYKNKDMLLSKVGRVVTSEINSGNLLVWTSEEQMETSISSTPFSGVIVPYRCHSSLANYSNCINQTTYLSESNFTVSPINRYINRGVLHTIELGQNYSNHEYQLSYKFLKDLSILNRDYRIIYQLYAPQGSSLTSVKLDEIDIPAETLLIQKFGQFEYFQIPISMVMDREHSVVIKFSTPIAITKDVTQTAFSLTEIKQPGISNQGVGLVIKTPNNIHASLVTSPVDTKPGEIYYKFPSKTSTFGLGLSLNR